MVIMSMETYEKGIFLNDVYSKLEAAEKQFAEGKVLDGNASLECIRQKYESFSDASSKQTY
jgi:hypothetical protein